ncbi:MAG: DUF983 domain-containing protein [Actinobacteria bacterium]|nr:DUF983 domain-containing protein [Actinomycetota bacterium]
MSAPEGFPGTTKLFVRGALRRCPRCGSGHLFEHYFTIKEDCPRCGLHFEREHGYWVGALAWNIAIVMALFIVTFVVIMVLTVPDVPVGLSLLILVPIMLIGPIVFYPFSKTLWMALDYGFLQRISDST